MDVYWLFRISLFKNDLLILETNEIIKKMKIFLFCRHFFRDFLKTLLTKIYFALKGNPELDNAREALNRYTQ